jgi:hypothetical protein
MEKRPMSNLHDDLVMAMQSPQPALHFRESVKRLVDAGADRDDVRVELEGLREKAPEAEEDVILEVLDFLQGWCNPNMRI